MLKTRQFIHIKSGAIYTLLTISNEEATNPDFVKQAVYLDADGNVWSRPLTEFEEKFIEITSGVETIPTELRKLSQELHQATRQFLRFNGVDKAKAEAAFRALTHASFQVTLYLERDQDD